MCAIIVGRQIDRTGEFSKGAVIVLEFEIGLAQLKMRLGKARIHLHRVAILNGRFAELALFAIAVAALQKLLLADVGVAIATSEQRRNQEPDQQQPDGNRAAHVSSKHAFSKAERARTQPRTFDHYTKVLQEGVEDKVTAVMACTAPEP